MAHLTRPLALLGPQPNYESLKMALRQMRIKAPVALVTAGWETEEGDDEKIRQEIGINSVNLRLFARTESLFAEDRELIGTLRERQDRLRHLRDAYNHRLNHLLKAARHIIRRHEPLQDYEPERESAIDMVRRLDQEYFDRTSVIIQEYEDRLQTARRPHVQHHRHEIAHLLNQVHAILISGGHVAIILNRLKIFGILEMRPELPVIAWSGGTMALADQVVFFHDSPPQGPGDPELLRAGMGVFRDVLPLPDARRRLKLDDQARVRLFASRFRRSKCVIFDEQTALVRQEGRWHAEGGAARLCESGRVVEFDA